MIERHAHAPLVDAANRKNLINITGLTKGAISHWCKNGIPFEWRGLVARLLRESGKEYLIPFNFLGDRTPEEVEAQQRETSGVPMSGAAE